MSKTFWKSDGFMGFAVSLALLFAGNGELLQSLERKAYDLGVAATSREPNDRIAVIAIDKQSIDNIGRWPWSREVHARMIEALAAAKAKVVAPIVFFAEPQIDPGLAYINKLIDVYNQAGGVPFSGGAEALAAQAPPLGQFGPLLAQAEQQLNADRRLGEAVTKAGNVVLPALFVLGEPRGKPDRPLPDFLRRNAITQVERGGDAPLPTRDIDASIVEAIGRGAAAIGHLNVNPDVDGAIRTEPLALDHFGELYPSLSLMIAAKSLNLALSDIKVSLGNTVRLGSLRIGTDPVLQMHTFFYKDRDGKPAFPVDAFYDVASGKIPLEKYKDKIVLIGPTVGGSAGNSFVTPVSPAMPAVLMQAHAVSSILQEHFFVVPTWAGWAERGVFLLVAAYLVVLLPRLRAGMGAALTAALFALLLAAQFALITTQLLWLQLMLPATLLLVGHLLLTTKRFFATERGKEKSEADSAESNRMLGLAFQGQGQLDLAFDKFRKCPFDDGLMENLYNLGLDFERKRQFNKAESVFRHMAGFNPKFRDLEQKLARARAMAETVMLGGGRTTAQGTLILAGGQVEKPMLGRYQVEKELGKGAMGVVYQGRDPKINRVVAIKTMALSQEFEEDELAEVKARFYREAQTAGRLNHPNIVTIFDAGEEHDLAYIAMEFLKGRDLVPYTKAGNLMPLPKVMALAARIADALAYAHDNQVVHRDVKPANIMYEPESGALKVTDFGIARITDSSRTKTGMVLGTPSYMSPEQLAGRKIDGRSDLFSLGVMLYQLACGRLPFEGESMAQLMFRIANEPPADIRAINPQVPGCLAAIIDKALAKDMEKRFQSGAEMALALRACAEAAQADIGI